MYTQKEKDLVKGRTLGCFLINHKQSCENCKRVCHLPSPILTKKSNHVCYIQNFGFDWVKNNLIRFGMCHKEHSCFWLHYYWVMHSNSRKGWLCVNLGIHHDTIVDACLIERTMQTDIVKIKKYIKNIIFSHTNMNNFSRFHYLIQGNMETISYGWSLPIIFDSARNRVSNVTNSNASSMCAPNNHPAGFNLLENIFM